MVNTERKDQPNCLPYHYHPYVTAYMWARDRVDLLRNEIGMEIPIIRTNYFLRFENYEDVSMSTIDGEEGLRGLINIIKHRREDKKEAIILRTNPLMDGDRELDLIELKFAYEILNGSKLRLAA